MRFLGRDEPPAVFTADQIAEILGCSPWTVRRLIRQQQLRSIRIGRQYRIRPADLTAFLETGEFPGVASNHHTP